MDEPVTALCGAHNFCKACLTTHIQTVVQSSSWGYYNAPVTVTCPTCRAPIQNNPSQLHVNVALRDMIKATVTAPASAPAPAPAPPPVAKPAPPPIRIKAARIKGAGKLHVELEAPNNSQDSTMPILAIPVIDNSGSMGSSSAETGTDAAQLSRSDLVRHAVNTLTELLREEDEMALVVFDNNATVVMEPTRMVPAGRAVARAQAHKIGPNGGTSIWSGLQKALAIAERPSSAGKNIVIILQTDGESDPSYNPPRGIPATFRAWLDARPAVKITLHTIGYGFGRALDMALLRELARIGGGTVGYVPDASMVGTGFTHLSANLMTCQYRGVKLKLPDHGVCIPVGFLQAGAPRNFVIDLPDGVSAGEIAVTADNTATVFTTAEVGEVNDAAWPLAHDHICKEFRAALTAGASYNMAPLVAALRPSAADARVAAVLSDLTDPDKYKGQMGKAFESSATWERWGGHYMSGVLGGLENEWPINFKDATSAAFGAPSGMTRRLIDRGDEIFNSLPPPKASLHHHGGGGGGAAAPVNMAAINNAYGGCFLGASRVKMADGTEKRCDEIQPGDRDAAGYVIDKVIKMCVPYADVVRLSGPLRPANAPPAEGGFTPWHPVFPSPTGDYPAASSPGWIHPADIGTVERVQADAVYNFVLRYSDSEKQGRPGVLIVDGLMACTLGHDFKGPVISHPYFGEKEPGKRNILEDLAGLPGWTEGYVSIKHCLFHNDPDTGFICGLSTG
jgi:Mg-chelatase subunit ChlD